MSKESLIEWRNVRCLITDAPRAENIVTYLRLFKKYNVTDIARISEPSYETADLNGAGIHVHECFFPDGESPPEDVIDKVTTQMCTGHPTSLSPLFAAFIPTLPNDDNIV